MRAQRSSRSSDATCRNHCSPNRTGPRAALSALFASLRAVLALFFSRAARRFSAPAARRSPLGISSISPPKYVQLTDKLAQPAAKPLLADSRRNVPVKRILSAALLVAFAACTKKATTPTVQTAMVTQRDIIIDAQANGVIEPIQVIDVKSKASGLIIKMP